MYPFEPFNDNDLDKIRATQFNLIKKQINYAYKNSKFYKRMFDREGISPEDIKNLDDFRKIPITTKEDLRLHNKDFFAAPKEEWVDLLSTSGTTGDPIYIPQTKEDIYRVAKFGAQTLSLSGIEKKDTLHLAMPMSAWLWAAGFGFYMCFTTLGTTVLRFGPGFTDKSIETIVNLEATALLSVPSFAIKMGEIIKKRKIKHKISKIYTVGENVLTENLSHNTIGRKIEELWEASLYSCYGATEGPFLTVECKNHQGHHINPYEVFIEILDIKTLKPLPHGQKGAVTITPLGVKGMPLLRYLNGDVSFLISGRCPCGSMDQRIGPVVARTDEMIKIKGVVVYPEKIKNVISNFKIPIYQIEAYTQNFQDNVRIFIPQNLNISEKLSLALKENINVKINVVEIPQEELIQRIHPPNSRKPKIFVDKREKNTH